MLRRLQWSRLSMHWHTEMLSEWLPSDLWKCTASECNRCVRIARCAYQRKCDECGIRNASKSTHYMGNAASSWRWNRIDWLCGWSTCSCRSHIFTTQIERLVCDALDRKRNSTVGRRHRTVNFPFYCFAKLRAFLFVKYKIIFVHFRISSILALKIGRWYEYRVAAVNQNGTRGYSQTSKPFQLNESKKKILSNFSSNSLILFSCARQLRKLCQAQPISPSKHHRNCYKIVAFTRESLGSHRSPIIPSRNSNLPGRYIFPKVRDHFSRKRH